MIHEQARKLRRESLWICDWIFFPLALLGRKIFTDFQVKIQSLFIQSRWFEWETREKDLVPMQGCIKSPHSIFIGFVFVGNYFKEPKPEILRPKQNRTESGTWIGFNPNSALHIPETRDVPNAVDRAQPEGLPGARRARRTAGRSRAARDFQGDHGHRRPEPG